jgi:DNA-binding MarR family transcriptional regulator
MAAMPPTIPADNAFLELIRTFGVAERVMQPYFAGFGISGSQWGVLRNLHRAEEAGLAGLRLSELSDRMLIRPPSVTGLVGRLERAGLVVRDPAPNDLRGKLLSLTPKGRQLINRILKVHGRQIQTVLTGLNPAEQGELHRLLVVWRKHLQSLLERDTALLA